MPPEPSPSRSGSDDAPSQERSRRRHHEPRGLPWSATIVILATLLAVAWGTFAFGAVYEWAFTPLALGAAAIGLLGAATGTRPAIRPNRGWLLALAGIALVGVAQLIPLPLRVLSSMSPATVTFLSNYDLRFLLVPNLDTRVPVVPVLRHSLSIKPDSTLVFLGLFAALMLLLVGLVRTLSRRSTLRMARGVVFIGVVLALVGIVQKAALGDHAFGGMRIYGFWQPENLLTTPFGPYVNKNHFAGWMLMGIPVALGLLMAQVQEAKARRRGRGVRGLAVWLSEPEGGRVATYTVAVFLMTFSLVMTGSRSGLVCLALVAVGFAVLFARGSSRRAAFGAAAVALALIVVSLQWAGADSALQRFAQEPDALGLRLTIWRTSLEMARQFPVLGTGLNTFGIATVIFEPHGNLHYNEAHNDYVQLLVEGGLVTLGLAVVAIILVARTVAARFRAGYDGEEYAWLRAGAVTGLVAVGLQSMVEFSLQMPGNAVLFVVLLAMAVYTPARLRRDDDRVR